ncbi:MAG: hypothetical protein AAB368_12060, partial [bacterium]
KYAAPLFLALALLAGRGLALLPPKAALAGAVLLAAELALDRPGPLPAPYDPLRPAPYVEWLRARQAEEPEARLCGIGASLCPMTAAAFGLRDVRALPAAMDRVQFRVLSEGFAAPKPPRLGMFLTLDTLDARRFEVIRNLGVRWFVAPPAWRPPPALAGALTPAYRGEMLVFRVRDARPFAGFPERGRRAFALGLWGGGPLGLGLLAAGLAALSRKPGRAGRPRRRASARSARAR